MRSFLTTLVLAQTAASLTAPTFSRTAVIAENFTDPSLIQEPNGQYWAFGSHNSHFNIPIARSQDFTSWTLQTFDALPDAGSWTASNPAVQGPDVNLLDSGKYIMYYSAALATNSSIHCIGVATSDNIRGPYAPNSQPWFCPEDEGGAGDPSAFQDPVDGALYVLFKVNGNDLVAGGICGNESPTATARSTPIMIQQVSPQDGQTCVGKASIVLQRDASEGPRISAPSLTAYWNADAPNGYAYFLFYSAGCADSVKYATKYATNTKGPAQGMYTKAATPLMKSGDGKDLHSPASLDISGDGEHVLFSSYEHAYVHGRRQLRTGMVKIDGLQVSI